VAVIVTFDHAPPCTRWTAARVAALIGRRPPVEAILEIEGLVLGDGRIIAAVLNTDGDGVRLTLDVPSQRAN